MQQELVKTVRFAMNDFEGTKFFVLGLTAHHSPHLFFYLCKKNLK